jgi:hypothetical protein
VIGVIFRFRKALDDYDGGGGGGGDSDCDGDGVVMIMDNDNLFFCYIVYGEVSLQ